MLVTTSVVLSLVAAAGALSSIWNLRRMHKIHAGYRHRVEDVVLTISTPIGETGRWATLLGPVSLASLGAAAVAGVDGWHDDVHGTIRIAVEVRS